MTSPDEPDPTRDQVRFLQIEPTTRCNFTCGFCAGRSMPQADLGFDAFLGTLAAFPDLGHVELQGEGESLMHPRFFDMVEAARRRGVKVSFITNGSFLSPEDVERLLDLGVEKVSVSLESPDPATFRRIRGGKLEKVVRGVETLMAARRRRGLDRPIVGFSVTVLRETQDQLAEIVALYRRLGLDGGMTLQPLERKADYRRGYDEAMAAQTLTDDEVERAYVRFLGNRELRRLNGPERSRVAGFYDELMVGWRPGLRRCPWLETGLYVNYEGMVSPCCMVKDKEHALGRVGVDVPEEMLRRRARLRDELGRGRIPAACDGCELARYAVVGPWGMLVLGVRGMWQRLFGRLPGSAAGSSGS